MLSSSAPVIPHPHTLSPSRPPALPPSLPPSLPPLQEQLSNSKFMKTYRCKVDGLPVVVKVYVKRDAEEVGLGGGREGGKEGGREGAEGGREGGVVIRCDGGREGGREGDGQCICFYSLRSPASESI